MTRRGRISDSLARTTASLSKAASRKWSAQIEFDANDLAHSHLDVSVDTASVETGVEEQDAALLGTEWLATKLFPQARFVARTIRRGQAADTFDASGELTLRGISKPVSISFVAQRLGTELSMKGTASLDRGQFEVGTGQWSRPDSVPFRVEVQFEVMARTAGGDRCRRR